MEWLADPQAWIAFFTLLILELVLGIDNVIFISILAGKLPKEQQKTARRTGLALAVVSRLLLLLLLSWILSLEEELFTLFDIGFSGQDIILILGGLFLMGKSTHEIHGKLEGEEGHASAKVSATFTSVILQVLLLDVVFSLDSIITAVGLVDEIPIMVAAILIAAGVMIALAEPIGQFVDRHPTVKMLALAFLLLIGFTILLEGFHQKIPKGYIYFAMAFSVGVELLNMRLRSVNKPVKLNKAYVEESEQPAAASTD